MAEIANPDENKEKEEKEISVMLTNNPYLNLGCVCVELHADWGILEDEIHTP